MDGIDPTRLPTIHSLGQTLPKDVDEKTALQSFEAYIVGEMLRRAAPQNPTGLFDGGQAGRMYQDHLYQEFARVIAEQGSLGLATQLEGSLGGDPADEGDSQRDERTREESE